MFWDLFYDQHVLYFKKETEHSEINQSCERKCHYIKLNIHKSLNKTAINSCIKYNILARKLNTYDTLCLTQLITINVLRGWKQATGTCTLHHCTGIKCHQVAIHTRKDPYTRYGQPLALKIGRTCLVYRVIREFRVGNVLIYIRSPVQAVAEAKT